MKLCDTFVQSLTLRDRNVLRSIRIPLQACSPPYFKYSTAEQLVEIWQQNASHSETKTQKYFAMGHFRKRLNTLANNQGNGPCNIH